MGTWDRRRAAAALLVVAWAALAGCGDDGPVERVLTPTGDLLVLAAASTRSVLAGALAEAPGSRPAVASYGGSGALRRQVEGGVPAHVVVFADAGDVDALVAGGWADADSRIVLATNRLVLVAPPDTIVDFSTVDRLPSGSLLGVGDPRSVPAGRYAQAALEQRGAWAGVQGRLAFAPDVTVLVAQARRGELAAALVYATDVRGLDELVVKDTAAWPGAPRPEVVAALTTLGAADPDARALLAWLGSDEGRSRFLRAGFGAP